MEAFKNRTFLSMDGDKIKASFDEKTLHISLISILMEVELTDVQIDNWYEKGNIRVKLVSDGLLISAGKEGFPRNTIKYFRVN
jgi:hypothetical protein